MLREENTDFSLAGRGRGLAQGRHQNQKRVRPQDPRGECWSGDRQKLHLHSFQPGAARSIMVLAPAILMLHISIADEDININI